MMIEVNNVSFSYGRKKSKVLDGFSMQLEKGAVYGLLGKNGTGKSTLLYLMAGLLRPQSGQVCYQGVDVTLRQPSTLQDMFLVPEEFALPGVSLKQYVSFLIIYIYLLKVNICLISISYNFRKYLVAY